jgi:OOP family OmpA-OmpF porin
VQPFATRKWYSSTQRGNIMKKIATALLFSIAISAPAFAANKPFYVTADYGQLSMSNADPFPNPGAARVTGGYRFNPNFAVEAGLMAVDDSTYANSVYSVTYAQSSLQASGVFSLPLNNSFSLFGKVGVASNYAKMTGTGVYASINTSATTTSVIYGFGGQFDFNQSVGVRMQYEYLGKSKPASYPTEITEIDLRRVSAGVIFSF